MKTKEFIINIYNWFFELPFVANIRFKKNMDDKKYIEYLYKKRFGEYPNLDNPVNFNEKNNWRKLYDRNDLYTDLVDKYTIKKIIEQKLSKDNTFKLLGSWDTIDDIDISKLPTQFVLKVNHAGGVYICYDKNTFNLKKVKKLLRRDLHKNYFIRSREWPYKNVKRKIIAEQYMGENLLDYKNYCFNGKVQYTFVWKNIKNEEGTKPKAFFCGAYNRMWEKIDLELDYPTMDIVIEKPKKYEEMIACSEVMSKDISFVRCDCYVINDFVYVGEMTFFPWGGFMKFKNKKWNNYFGSLEKLENIPRQK